jgi:hypothetical protein
MSSGWEGHCTKRDILLTELEKTILLLLLYLNTTEKVLNKICHVFSKHIDTKAKGC